MKEEPNNVEWVVKFIQKMNLTLLPKIMHGRVVVNYVSSTPKQIPRNRTYKFRIFSAPRYNSELGLSRKRSPGAQ